MRVLVVYYSRTGRTRQLAERLARELHGTTLAITEPRTRFGLLGYPRSLIEAVTGRDAAIDAPRRSPLEYDLVLFGTPVWGWHLSSPMRALARRWSRRAARVAFFATMGGSGSRAAFDELRRLLGRPPLAELALTERECADLTAPESRLKVERFVQRLQQAFESKQRRAA